MIRLEKKIMNRKNGLNRFLIHVPQVRSLPGAPDIKGFAKIIFANPFLLARLGEGRLKIVEYKGVSELSLDFFLLPTSFCPHFVPVFLMFLNDLM